MTHPRQVHCEHENSQGQSKDHKKDLRSLAKWGSCAAQRRQNRPGACSASLAARADPPEASASVLLGRCVSSFVERCATRAEQHGCDEGQLLVPKLERNRRAASMHRLHRETCASIHCGNNDGCSDPERK